jgi:channel protein (hemolysin III family)
MSILHRRPGNGADRPPQEDDHRRVEGHDRLGDILAIAGSIYLIAASTRESIWAVVSWAIFAATLILAYLCSTLYHSLVRTRARHVFRGP